MVQECVVIVEDVPLGDGIIAVMLSEFRQRPIGDVLTSVCAVFVVGVEGETLGAAVCEFENLEFQGLEIGK